MSYAVLRVLAARLEREGRLLELEPGAAARSASASSCATPVERPPMVSARERARARLYVDLDGTLLGHGASLLHDGDGRGLAARACARSRRACAPASRS